MERLMQQVRTGSPGFQLQRLALVEARWLPTEQEAIGTCQKT